jgi:hypothetical protein
MEPKSVRNGSTCALVLAAALTGVTMFAGQHAIPGVYASDINCSEEPNHELCNGERGRSGMTFCDLAGIPEDGDCYSRDYSQINCDEDPEHSRCVGTTGLDGLIFCDEDPEADPCYDRRTN